MTKTIEEEKARTAKLQELIDIKEKYDTTIIKCMENELFPVMEEKISKKLISLMDKK